MVCRGRINLELENQDMIVCVGNDFNGGTWFMVVLEKVVEFSWKEQRLQLNPVTFSASQTMWFDFCSMTAILLTTPSHLSCMCCYSHGGQHENIWLIHCGLLSNIGKTVNSNTYIPHLPKSIEGKNRVNTFTKYPWQANRKQTF